MNSDQRTRLAEVVTLPFMDEILMHAPAVQGLLERAVTTTGERWEAYSHLKASASLLVGWNAVSPLLRDSVYYDALLRVFDFLLPDDSWEEDGCAGRREEEGVA